MTSELEQKFYDTFGIEPKWKDKRVKNSKTYYTKEQADYLRSTTKNRNIQLCYPEITDRILLELICIANKANIEVIGETVEETKNKLIEEMIYWKDDIIHKEIQQLFKEEECIANRY